MEKSLDQILPEENQIMSEIMRTPIKTGEILDVIRDQRMEKVNFDLESTPEIAGHLGVSLAKLDQDVAATREFFLEERIKRIQDPDELEKNFWAERIARVLAVRENISGKFAPEEMRMAIRKLKLVSEDQKKALHQVIELLSFFAVSDYLKKILGIEELFDINTIGQAGYDSFELQGRISEMQFLMTQRILLEVMEADECKNPKNEENENVSKHMFRLSSTSPDFTLSGPGSLWEDIETNEIRELLIGDKSIMNDRELKLAISYFPNIETLTFENDRTWDFREMSMIIQQVKNPEKLKTIKLPSDIEIACSEMDNLTSQIWEQVDIQRGTLVIDEYNANLEGFRFLPLRMEIHECLRPETIEDISKMLSLEDIEIHQSGDLDDGFFEILAQLPYLKTLTVHQICYDPESFKKLAESRLQELYFSDSTLTDEDLSAIQSLQIHTLYLGATEQVTYAGLKNIPMTLEHLMLDDCENFSDIEFTSISQTNVKKLYIGGMSMTPAQLENLSIMKNLKHLILARIEGIDETSLEAFRKKRPDVELTC